METKPEKFYSVQHGNETRYFRDLDGLWDQTIKTFQEDETNDVFVFRHDVVFQLTGPGIEETFDTFFEALVAKKKILKECSVELEITCYHTPNHLASFYAPLFF